MACRRQPAPAGSETVNGGELIASLRSEPANYNRYFDASAAADVVALLTQARLVRVNRATDALEPALAESWEASPDGRSQTLKLRKGVTFSDGAPFTSADVLFSFAVAYDAPGSQLAESITAAGQRLDVTAPDATTVIVTFPTPFAPGSGCSTTCRSFHGTSSSRRSAPKRFRKRGPGPRRSPRSSGSGPSSCQSMSPASGWCLRATRTTGARTSTRSRLPYLDRLTIEIIPDQNAEALRLESGATDLMSNADIRPDDYARFKRLADQGRLKLLDAGVGLDPNVLWFNLKPPSKDAKPWLRRTEFRQALSFGVDRQAIANTAYLGAAVPVFGPITPRHGPWYSTDIPGYAYDPAKARRLLAASGLTDRDGTASSKMRRAPRCGSRCWCRRTPRFESAPWRFSRNNFGLLASLSTSSDSTSGASRNAGSAATTTASFTAFRRARPIRR